jgi:DnaJ-domain-containing protein 1
MSKKLSALIVDLALSVLDEGDDEAMKALYNQHRRSDFDAEATAQLEQMKFMLEDTLGVDLGDEVDLRSPEELLARLQTHFQAQEEARPQAKPRKKTAKQPAREAQREAEAQQLSQSLREVYRKLASALHPDREADPEERPRKTALTQQANEAYERGNLLELLELQLQLEHIDPAHLANLSADRLKHYLRILKDQVRELDAELQGIERRPAAEFGLPPFGKLTPTGLMAQLRADVAATEIQLRRLQKQIDAAGDLKSLKAWLKTVTRRPPLPDFDLRF